MANWEEWIEELSERTGAPVEQSDIDRLYATNPDDPNDPNNNDTTRLTQALESQYARRGRDDSPDSQDLEGYGSARGETADDYRSSGSSGARGSSVAQAWNSGGGGGGGGGGSYGANAGDLFPDWYRELLQRQVAQVDEERAANKARADALYNTLNQRAGQSLIIKRPGTPGYVGTPGTPGTAAIPAGPLSPADVERLISQLNTQGLLDSQDTASGINAPIREFAVGKTAQEIVDELNRQGAARGNFNPQTVPTEWQGTPGTPGTPADPNVDPNAHIWAQVDNFAAQNERARRNYLSDVAERSGPLSNIRGEERMTAERLGQTVGGFEAELVGREIQARRDEIAEALRLNAGLLSGDQQRTLQQQLSLLDQAIQEQQVALGYRGQDLDYDSFLRDLALREFDTTNKWDYAWQTL